MTVQAQPSNYRAIVETAIAKAQNELKVDLHTDAGLHRLTQRIAEILVCQDSNWGRKSTNTGPISGDTVAYRLGPLGPDGRNTPMRVLDYCINCGDGGTNASIGWIDYGVITDQRFIPIGTENCGGAEPDPDPDPDPEPDPEMATILKIIIEGQARQIELLEEQIRLQQEQTATLRQAIAELRAEVARGIRIRF